ncbi:UNVERIFIED_CONTAM: Origin recognition complex subunit 5 [Gekko kuhli]
MVVLEEFEHHGTIKKKKNQKKHEKTSNHLLGPKTFPLDRLLAILHSIIDYRVAPTANIFSQSHMETVHAQVSCGNVS